MRKAYFVGRYEYPETINGAYELLGHTSRQFGGSILRVGRRVFRNERGHSGRTSVVFTQTICDQCERKYTTGRNSFQGYTVPGKYGQLYRHTEWYVCHRYGEFSDQCPNKKTKEIVLVTIGDRVQDSLLKKSSV